MNGEMAQRRKYNCNRDTVPLKLLYEDQNELITWEKQKSEILIEIAEKLLLSSKPQEVVQELCEKVMSFLNCSAFFNYLADHNKSKLHLNAFSGIPAEAAEEIVWLDYGVAVCGCVAQCGSRIVAEHIQATPDVRTDLVKSFGIRAYACHPIVSKSKVIGTLSFGTKYKDTFDEDELILMRAVANFVAVAMTRIHSEQIIIEQQKLLLDSEREKNETLKNALEIKDEFLSLISHELRTPITIINSAIQNLNLLYENQLTDKVKDYLATIRRNTFRQLRLVNNILDTTRAEAGTIKLHKKNIDIVSLTKYIAESVRTYADQKGVTLTYKSSCQKKIIAVDEEKYERILLNLLSNALKFTPRGKEVGVKLHLEESWVSVDIEDQGPGIPANKLNKIFERFEQVDSTLSRPTEGVGIGLYLTKRFIHALGGEIFVKSKLNFGSTFTILIPVELAASLNHENSDFQIIKNDLAEIAKVEFSDIYI